VGSLATWGGIYPATLTMFDADGGLDIDATVRHVDGLVQRGAHGIVLAGTTGEFIAMGREERGALTREVTSAVAGRVPVIVGTGAYSTAETIALTNDAQAAGADAGLVILPYYQRPAREEVMGHFRLVADATDLPLFLYNNPTNSGTEPLDAADIGVLAAEGVLAGIKSTFPTVHQVHEAIAETDASFRVFYGSFMAPLEGMAGGAAGWISGILNVVLPDALDLWSAMQAGDIERARAAWSRILPIKYLYTRRPFGQVSDLEIYRAMLRLRGEHGGHSRAPLRPLSENQVDSLRGLLSRAGLR
jgi:4-hydroxy-tetrahydrodipicolinate synthase